MGNDGNSVRLVIGTRLDEDRNEVEITYRGSLHPSWPVRVNKEKGNQHMMNIWSFVIEDSPEKEKCLEEGFSPKDIFENLREEVIEAYINGVGDKYKIFPYYCGTDAHKEKYKEVYKAKGKKEAVTFSYGFVREQNS